MPPPNGRPAAGRPHRKLYDEAATCCQQSGDLQGWTEAVLGAASVYLFGSEPGKLPAQLYDVLARTTDDANRARLAAALARCWAYAGHAGAGSPVLPTRRSSGRAGRVTRN